LSIEARVRNAWYDLALARAVEKVVDERQTAAQQIEETVRHRYAAGLGVQQDVLRAQVELARVGELKATQQAAIASATAQLNRLAGTTGEATLPATDAIPSEADLISAAVAHSPEAAAAQANIEGSRIGVAAAKKNFYPDLTVNAGSMYRGNFEMGPMWQVGVGFSVPLWTERRQQNLLASAQATVNARTADRDVIVRELELRTRERIAQLTAANGIAAIYRDKILPLDQVSLESALASYEAGKVPFITVLDALNSLYSDRVTYASRLAEAAKWRVAIDEASLQPTAMSGGPAMSAGATSMTSTTPTSASPASGAATSMR
ncbi:MAG TPA: TolC family protein, partial [Thermoanaerobaculia bacterium]|nr:TolC family protein [Thermoanaerobaculia bacterium]